MGGGTGFAGPFLMGKLAGLPGGYATWCTPAPRADEQLMGGGTGFGGPFLMGKLAGLPGGYGTAMIVMGCVNLLNGVLIFCTSRDSPYSCTCLRVILTRHGHVISKGRAHVHMLACDIEKTWACAPPDVGICMTTPFPLCLFCLFHLLPYRIRSPNEVC
jgi:hypothetical protein